MAISARASHVITLPDGSEQALREATGDAVPTCNTCGQEAGLHVFRPAIAYRCASCLTRWGKAQTVTVAGTVTLSTDGTHIGPVAIIP